MKNTNTITFKQIREEYKTISLKTFCETTELCYQYILKASKKPIAGQPYDPTAVNYDAVQKIIDQKGVVLSSFDWDKINLEHILRTTPVNAIDDFKIGTQFKLRTDDNVYRVVYISITCIAFVDSFDEKIRTMSHDTFIHQSPRIINNAE